MSSSYSSLLSQGNPVAADTEATPAPQAPASEGKYSSLLNPSPAANSYSSLINQPKPQENPESSVVPVSPAPITSGSYSSLLGSQAPSEKYSDSPVLTNDEVDYAKKSPDEMEDEPWYSKAWEWANSPLYDLHKWGTREGAGAFEKGLETGLEDIGSGFTSPLQIGLTLATFGGGAIEEAGASLLGSIGVTKNAAKTVAATAKLLMTGGFSAQMIGGLVTQSPQFLDALKDGDVENATRLGTNIAASGIFLREGLKHGYEDLSTVKNYLKGKTLTTTERLGLVQELAGIYDESKAKGTDFARERQEAIIAQLKAAGAFGDEITEAGIRHYMTQDGDISRIEKMHGIAEGTIKPREWTPDEVKQQDQIAELRSWAADSHKITKAGEAPREFYLTDSADGTHKLGQTLTTEKGDASDAHYVQMKNPYPATTEDSLKRFIEQSGGQEQAKKLLQDRGYDSIVYQGEDGDQKFVTFDNHQYRPVEQYKAIHDAAWSRDHAYIAVDKKNLPKILNQGIGLDPKRNNVVYHASPGAAIDNAVLPDSGNKGDLVVLSVPRAEVEKGVYETNAAVHAQTSDRAAIGPVEVLPRVNRRPGASPLELRSDTEEINGSKEHDFSGQYDVTIHHPSGEQVGNVHVGLDNTGGVLMANVNDSGIHSGASKPNELSPYRNEGYGKAMYIEAMRLAKQRGVKWFANDEAGATSPQAKRVWDSLIKQFNGTYKLQRLEGFGTNAEPIPVHRFKIDLSKIDPSTLEAASKSAMDAANTESTKLAASRTPLTDKLDMQDLQRRVNKMMSVGSGKMGDSAGAIGEPMEPGYERHHSLPDHLKESGGVTSDRELHAHELAHSIWGYLRGLPIGDIVSWRDRDANSGKNFLASAEVNSRMFRDSKGNWKQNIEPQHVEGLLDMYMAGTAADEIVSGLKTDKSTLRNPGNRGDIEDAFGLLRSQSHLSYKDQLNVLRSSLDRVKKEMQDHGIDTIIKQEFAKGREPNLAVTAHYLRGRLVKLGERAKDAINGKTTEGNNATTAINEGTRQAQAVRRTQGQSDGAPQENLRPPVRDEDLVTEKRHMPGHLLEMEQFKDKDGNDSVRATGRSTPLRPLGAEDLPGNAARFNSQYTPAEKQKYLAGLKAATRLTDEQKAIAKTLRGAYDSSFQRAYEGGMIRSWVEAYHPQAWANENASMWHRLFNNDPEEVTNGALNDLRHTTNSGQFDTNINSAKHRAYNTEFQGVMAGEKFKTADLSQHLFNHLKGIEHAQAARDFVNNLRKKDTRAADNRPMVVLQGTARKFGGDENPAVAINPSRTQKIHIDPEKVKAMMDPNPQTGTNELQEGLKNGTIEKLPFTTEDEKGQKMAAYAYTSDGYETIDHPSMRAWGYIGQDTAGNPALMEGQMKVHPDIAQYVRQVMGVEGSPVRNSKILGGINAAAGEAKGLLLSFSPFHIVQEGLRAALVGINPTKFDHININDSPDLQRGVRKGLVRNNYQAEDQYSTGFASHSRIISKLPGLNRIQNAMQSFLFDKYIPGLKDRAYLKLYQDILTKNPSLLPDEAASRAADMTNDVFGGQNWRKLGVTTAQQDFMRMSLLAPDWLVSEVRMLGRASGAMDKETGAISRKQMAIQMAAIWGTARVLNMLATGQMHNEAPFGVAHKDKDGKEVVYSVRTLPTDLLHVMSDPEGFIRGRVNPLVVRPAVEALSGRDEQGRRAPAATQLKDMIQNVAPIVGQGIFKGSSLNPIQQVAKGLGASVARYRTEAEKMADQYASDRMPSGPVDQEHLAAHQKDLALEDALRQGQISKGQLKTQVAARRADEIARRVNMSPLQARFDRLPLSEALNVWAAATPSEKDLLHTQLWKKRVAWLKLHSGAERVNEPVWRKLQSTFADLK